MIFEVDNTLVQAICNFEGLRTTAYKCPAGVYTIGYGHTKGVKKGQKITKEQAVQYLYQDLDPIVDHLNGLNICRTQGQFNAIVDFIFNLGISAFSRSTLYKYIKNKYSDDAICNQIMRWVYAGGKKLNGLIKRRQWECDMWKSK